MIKIFLLATIVASVAIADEGMWALNNFPSAAVKQKYNFDVTKDWLNHVQLSSARLAGGCSASFVSKNGLVMTNHHCAESCIEQLSSASKDFVASGFYAKSAGDEVKCPEIEINKLAEITDVTARVRAATKNSKDFGQDLKIISTTIEKECAKDSDKVRCDIVNLYHGGQYHLYRYERYQDVRLVFAPEFSIAFFGGDPDNFNFPRFDLDVSFLRVYEGNKPLETKDYFKWSDKGAIDGELSFVTGNPGSTSRLLTVAQLEFVRDQAMVVTLLDMAEQRGYITEFQNRGEEQRRISGGQLFGVENSLKALKGRWQSLVSSDFVSKRKLEEKKLRAKIDSNPKWKKMYGSAWTDLEKIYADYKNVYREMDIVERNSFGSRLVSLARGFVRAADEFPKKNELRLREFTDSRRPQMMQRWLSPAPIYDEFEIAMLTYHLTKMREVLGPDHPLVKSVLKSRSPAAYAAELIKNTGLKNLKNREALINGGKEAIEKSQDPLILFARAMEPEAYRLRKLYEDKYESVMQKAEEKVAQAQFAVYGDKRYPDATFTMRISYGTVKGYEDKGKFVPPITTIAGAYERNTGSNPFALPGSWMKAKNKVNMQTPMNFCSTNDIIGGNSGSPVINKEAEIIGLIFDGNIYSLGGAFGYDPSQNRAVAVHSSALLEALKNVYGAGRIVDEIKSP